MRFSNNVLSLCHQFLINLNLCDLFIFKIVDLYGIKNMQCFKAKSKILRQREKLMTSF